MIALKIENPLQNGFRPLLVRPLISLEQDEDIIERIPNWMAGRVVQMFRVKVPHHRHPEQLPLWIVMGVPIGRHLSKQQRGDVFGGGRGLHGGHW